MAEPFWTVYLPSQFPKSVELARATLERPNHKKTTSNRMPAEKPNTNGNLFPTTPLIFIFFLFEYQPAVGRLFKGRQDMAMIAC